MAKPKHPPKPLPNAPSPQYALGLTGAYPVVAGIEGVVYLNEKYLLKAILGPSLAFSLDHTVSASTVVHESILDGSTSLAIHYPATRIPLTIKYSRILGADLGYRLQDNVAFTVGFLYRRIELSGVGDVPLFASVRAGSNAENDINLHSHIHASFQCALDQVDLRFGGSWQTTFMKNFYAQLFGGFWYSVFRVVEPRASVTAQSGIQQQVFGSSLNISEIIRPHLSDIESGINDDLIEESLSNRIVLPLFAGIAVGYSF